MNEYQEEKAPPLTTIVNFRDVASLVKNIKPGLLYRSANLGECSPQPHHRKAPANHVLQTTQVKKTSTFFVNGTG